MPAYQGALNYAYHLDAGKFAALLRRHAVQRLGVRHIADQVIEVCAGEAGDVAALVTRDLGAVAGDFFIDCSGHAAMLIGGHCGVGWIDRSDVLINDRALAAQVPTAPVAPIASPTVATAHRAGWVWDIALPRRRGIGCVYASRFMGDDAADAELRAYIARNVPGAHEVPVRRQAFPTRHTARFRPGHCRSEERRG